MIKQQQQHTKMQIELNFSPFLVVRAMQPKKKRLRNNRGHQASWGEGFEKAPQKNLRGEYKISPKQPDEDGAILSMCLSGGRKPGWQVCGNGTWKKACLAG